MTDPTWAAEARAMHADSATLKAIGIRFGVSQRQVRNLLVPNEREKHRIQARMYRAQHRKNNPLPPPDRPPAKPKVQRPAWVPPEIVPAWKQEYRRTRCEIAAASLARRMLAERRAQR